MDMHELWERHIVPGAAGGLVATGFMSAFMGLGKVFGWVGTPPPKQITKNAGRKADAEPSALPEPVVRAAWVTAHVSYGMTAGVIYSLVRRFFPPNREAAGLMYGEAFWALNYLGALPLLGLYPAPDEDSNTRAVVMIGAHAVYGVALGRAEGFIRETVKIG
jgi:uncharacterized membrane protein YagU involved in acid resistance